MESESEVTTYLVNMRKRADGLIPAIIGNAFDDANGVLISGGVNNIEREGYDQTERITREGE